jgi:hypothetical protein
MPAKSKSSAVNKFVSSEEAIAAFPPKGAMLAQCRVRRLRPGERDPLKPIIDGILSSPTADEDTKAWFEGFTAAETIIIEFAPRPGPEPVLDEWSE